MSVTATTTTFNYDPTLSATSLQRSLLAQILRNHCKQHSLEPEDMKKHAALAKSVKGMLEAVTAAEARAAIDPLLYSGIDQENGLTPSLVWDY